MTRDRFQRLPLKRLDYRVREGEREREYIFIFVELRLELVVELRFLLIAVIVYFCHVLSCRRRGNYNGYRYRYGRVHEKKTFFGQIFTFNGSHNNDSFKNSG